MFTKIFLALAAVAALTPTLRADPILQPVGVSSSIGSGGGSDISQAIDQSGLATTYTSLVTDFDTYLAASPAHASDSISTVWLSSINTYTGNIDFDLGGLYTVQSMAFWNLGNNDSDNITGFNLYADDNPAFSSPALLGSFGANPNTGPYSAVLPEVFAFAPTSASYVRLEITAHNNSGAQEVGFGEVTFEIQVPEPASLSLLTLGALALVRWKRS